MHISGEIRDDLLEQIKNHPARGNRTQAEFYEYIFERFLDLPDSRLANLEQTSRSLQLQVEFLKKRIEKTETLDKVVQNLEAQVQQLAATDTDAAEEHAGVTPSQAVISPNGTQEPEGDFVVVLDKADVCELGSRSWVDWTLRIVGGNADGRTFPDRVLDFPWSPRTDFCKRAFGLQPTDSLGKRLPEVIGRKVLVRRTKKPGPDGSPRMITYYHPFPTATGK